MARIVRRLRATLAHGQELVAHVDEGHAVNAPAQLEVEQAPVERERGVEVADLERDVVDAEQARHVRARRARRGRPARAATRRRPRSRHLPGVMAPAITEATPGWDASAAIASSSRLWPRSRAKRSSASIRS